MSRILVIKLGALGDFVQAFGAFSSIRAAFPDARITLLTTPPFEEFAKAAPWFDDVTTDQRPSLKHPIALLRLARTLHGFDRIFDLQTSGRSKTYFRLAGKPRNWSGISSGCCHPHANPSRNDMHTLARLDDQLRAAGVPPLPRTIPDWLRGHGPKIQGRYVVLVPGAAPHRPQKRWPVTRFAEVAQTLFSRGITPIIAGSATETPLAEQIRSRCPQAIDLTGKTSLIELAGVLDRAEQVIGNDTGPMHLAAAMDKPIIALFSVDSDPRLTAPLALTPGKTTILDVPDLALLPASRIEALLPA